MTEEQLKVYRYYRAIALSHLREWRQGYRANSGNMRKVLWDLRSLKTEAEAQH